MKSNEFDYKKDLAEKLPGLKEVEGFPIGDDRDIIALSEPPYFTACLNPYISDFIKEVGKPYDETIDKYHSEPFVAISVKVKPTLFTWLTHIILKYI